MGNIYLRKIVGDAIMFVYGITNLDNISINHNSPVSPMPLPEENDEANMLIKIEGNSCDVKLSWRIIPVTTPITYERVTIMLDGVPSTSYQATIPPHLSVWEQRQFLYNMIPVHIEERFDIIIDYNNDFIIGDMGAVELPVNDGTEYQQFSGTWQKIDFRMAGGSPAVFDTSLTFMIGDVISGYSIDTPTPPKNFKITVPSQTPNRNIISSTFTFTWTKPSTVPDEANYPITGYNFYYVRKSTGVKKKLTLGNVLTLVLNTSTPNLIPNSFPNGDYIVYVRAKTANGEGEPSSTLTITKV